MERPRRVLIVGRGIGGLATVRALARHGIEFDAIERAAAWSNPGVGMYLPANPVRALDALGVGAELRDRACEITRQRFLDHRGRLLLEVELPAVWGATGPCLANSHHDLHEILREGVTVRLGTAVTAVDLDGPLAQVDFRDHSSGDYDLMVGADGVRSWARSVFLGALRQGSSGRRVGASLLVVLREYRTGRCGSVAERPFSRSR